MDSCFCEVPVVIYQCMYICIYVYVYVCVCVYLRVRVHDMSLVCPKTDVICPKTEFTKECFYLRKIYKQRNTKYE